MKHVIAKINVACESGYLLLIDLVDAIDQERLGQMESDVVARHR